MNKQQTEQTKIIQTTTGKPQSYATNVCTNTQKNKKHSHKKITNTEEYDPYQNILDNGKKESDNNTLQTAAHCPHCKHTYVYNMFAAEYATWYRSVHFINVQNVQPPNNNTNNEKLLETQCQNCDKTFILTKNQARFDN